MATWGKITINPNKFNKDETFYYDYNTTSDCYYFHHVGEEDYGLGSEFFDIEERYSLERGELLMEALICHTLAFECGGDIQEFVKRYIDNNRFLLKQKESK